MLSRFVNRPVSPVALGNVSAGGYVDTGLGAQYSRFFLTFEPVGAEPVVVHTHPAVLPVYEEAIQTFGNVSGVMIAPFYSTISTVAPTHRFTFSTAVNNVQLYRCITVEMLYLSKSVGPVSISTYGPESSAPFTAIVTCKPLFLEPYPALRYYTGNPGNATNLDTFVTSLVNLKEYAATELILNKQVQCQIKYEYHVGKEGLVVSAELLTDTTAPKYTLVANLVVGIPLGGAQNTVTVGIENLASYSKRAYVPRRGSHDELAYQTMPPIVLSCASLDEIQASGRLRYEHSILLTGEAAVNRYVVTVNVLEGSGNISIYDNEQEFAELAEYEQ